MALRVKGKTMPSGFKNCAPINANVNSSGLDQNCYYCTVAALKNVDVKTLVGLTETMQQDTARYDEIRQLFREAGFHAEAYVMRGLNVGEANADQFCSAVQMDALLKTTLSAGECCGIAYLRPDKTGHMIVAGRVSNATLSPNVIQCADFQTPAATRQLQNFPPENGVNYQYQAWLIDEMGELSLAFAKMTI
jgi:hypothetical protein